MRPELPFEFTPIIQRYIAELVDFIDEFYTISPETELILDAYDWDERITFKAEKNRYAFWQYLERVGAVKQWDSSEQIDKHQYPKNISEQYAAQPIYKAQNVHVLKPQCITDLSDSLKSLQEKSASKSKVVWSSVTKTITYEDKRHKFQSRTKENNEVLKIFVELWRVRLDKKERRKGESMTLKTLATRAEFSDDKIADVESRVSQAIRSLRRSLRGKGIPISITNMGDGAFQMIVAV